MAKVSVLAAFEKQKIAVAVAVLAMGFGFSAEAVPVKAVSGTAVVAKMAVNPLAGKRVDAAVAAQKVENYFNTMTTLQADFKQTITGDKPSSGVFMLQRPRQFLWQYMTPRKQRVVSTGTAVYYIDQEGSQVTQLPVTNGLGRIFNAKRLSLKEQGLNVTEARESAASLTVWMDVAKESRREDNAGLQSLRMTFTVLPKGGLQLATIEAVDVLKVTTRVDFSNVKTGMAFAKKTFAYTPGVYESRN